MFQHSTAKSPLVAAFIMSEIIYHGVVRSVRKTHGNALMSILVNMLQTITFVAVFYLMFTFLGLRGAALRGDFLLYIMSGIFLFLTHTKAVGAVAGSEGPSAPMMKHAPMNTIISIASAALGSLYIQVLSLAVVLFLYHAAFTPVHIEDPLGALGMLLLAWFSGIGVGMVFLALKPWFPSFTEIATTVYQRANMVASGKMFVANALPSYLLAMFDWNPLFHCIDQARGFVFANYFPRNSDFMYPFWVGLALLVLGLMGEFYTRRNVSISWSARR